jgi:hypothetical protein
MDAINSLAYKYVAGFFHRLFFGLSNSRVFVTKEGKLKTMKRTENATN